TAVTVLQHHRHEQGAAVDHGGVHHLTPVGGLAFDEGTEDAGDHEHGAPGEVAEEVDRGDRGTTRAAQGVQGAVHGDVVHVVSGTEGEGTVVSPAGDPRVNEARVEGQCIFRAQTEPFYVTGAKAFEEDVGAAEQVTGEFETFLGLQVGGQHGTALAHVGAGGARVHRIDGLGPIQADDARTQVGQEHPGHRRGPDTGELDDTDSVEGA